MRVLTIPTIVVLLLLVPLLTQAAKPPPLGSNEDAAGKPPPLGAPYRSGERAVPPSRYGADGERAAASGSGFVVADGRALTNNHVVAGCTRMMARDAAGQRTPARVLATDPRRDLALLSVPAGFAVPLVFRSNPDVARGESVVTYGFPLTGLLSSGPTLTIGNVSALTGLRDTPLHYTVTAPVQPGNSGGPMLDAQGHVIGVVVSKLNAARVAELTGGDIPQNVNFAIKGGEALAFLNDNGVTPVTSSSLGPDVGAAEVGRIADASTLFLQCFR